MTINTPHFSQVQTLPTPDWHAKTTQQRIDALRPLSFSLPNEMHREQTGKNLPLLKRILIAPVILLGFIGLGIRAAGGPRNALLMLPVVIVDALFVRPITTIKGLFS